MLTSATSPAGAISTDATCGAATVMVASPVRPPPVARITAWPGAFAVTSPAKLTDATASLLLAQVTDAFPDGVHQPVAFGAVSVSAGLDYPAVGPEHAFLKESGRADYVGASDSEALEAFALLARHEGIVCAFESAHALAHALKMADDAEEGTILVVGLSGRGDKDMAQARRLIGATS